MKLWIIETTWESMDGPEIGIFNSVWDDEQEARNQVRRLKEIYKEDLAFTGVSLLNAFLNSESDI